MDSLTIEDHLNQIAENTAIVRSALSDPNLEGFALEGLQRLLTDGLDSVVQVRKLLPMALLVMDVKGEEFP
jgi:hypothetical protein